VVIQFSKEFITSLNDIPTPDRKHAKAYLQLLYNWINSITSESQLAGIPMTNFFIFREKGNKLVRQVHPHRVYRVQFEKFNLFISVSGQMPLICRFHIIKGP
jgi:hypothetical protein